MKPAPNTTQPPIMYRRGPIQCMRYPSSGPVNPPSSLLRENATVIAVRVTPNSLCSGRKSAWAPELNTADWMVLTIVAAATIHHP